MFKQLKNTCNAWNDLQIILILKVLYHSSTCTDGSRFIRDASSQPNISPNRLIIKSQFVCLQILNIFQNHIQPSIDNTYSDILLYYFIITYMASYVRQNSHKHCLISIPIWTASHKLYVDWGFRTTCISLLHQIIYTVLYIGLHRPIRNSCFVFGQSRVQIWARKTRYRGWRFTCFSQSLSANAG
jgi:hypothetical protein